MHIANTKKKVLMMENIMKTTNSVCSANYLFDKFLPASALSFLSSPRTSVESTA